MMEAEELVRRFFDACRVLDVEVLEVEPGIWQLSLPEELSLETGLPRALTVYSKSVMSDHHDAHRLEKRSYPVQKLFSALKDKVIPNTSFAVTLDLQEGRGRYSHLFPDCALDISETERVKLDALFVWYKCTVAGSDTTEKVVPVGVDMNTLEVMPPYAVENLFAVPMREARVVPDEESFMNAIKKASACALEAISPVVDEKYANMAEECDDEVSRVETYYREMKQEGLLATTSRSSKKEGFLADMAKEKISLLRALKDKYSRSSIRVQLTPVGLATVEAEISRYDVKVSKGDHNVEFHVSPLSSHRDEMLVCSCCNAPDKPLVPWEGGFVCTDCIGFCSHCGLEVLKRDLHECEYCGAFVCGNCSYKSILTPRYFCLEHAASCSCCERGMFGIVELSICPCCGKTVCESCLTNTCSFCMKDVCGNCIVTSDSSGKPYCMYHIKTCPLCSNKYGQDEEIVCSTCGLAHCPSCGREGGYAACRYLEKVSSDDPRVRNAASFLGVEPGSCRWKATTSGSVHLVSGKKFAKKPFFISISVFDGSPELLKGEV